MESGSRTRTRISTLGEVFKIKTIGDCYVAVKGLPVPQPDHAIRMARFAHEIMLAASLESLLGPGTAFLVCKPTE
jgi:class 3 adenylate cyclase